MATLYKTDVRTGNDVWIAIVPVKEAKQIVKEKEENSEENYVYNFYKKDYEEDDFYNL